jgi:hypothetical protein
MLNITSNNVDNPYDEIIRTFFSIEFPSILPEGSTTLLEAISAALFATGQIRYGPKPRPEGLVAIRDIIRKAIEANNPIPILTPFGSRKTRLEEPLDIAEIFALKQIACLQKRITAFYRPGIQVNIRLEDSTGPYVFVDEGEASRFAEAAYCSTFIKLNHILGFDSFIHPILESTLFTERALTELADQFLPEMINYLAFSDMYGVESREDSPSWKRSNLLIGKILFPKCNVITIGIGIRPSTPALMTRGLPVSSPVISLKHGRAGNFVEREMPRHGMASISA